MSTTGSRLVARRLGIDTYRAPVIYMRADCPVCRSEGFEAPTRVRVEVNGRIVFATLNVVTSDVLQPGEAGFSEEAWRALGVNEGAPIAIAHASVLRSFGHVRAKLYGHHLDEPALETIVGDITAGRYPDVHLAAFVTACAGNRLDVGEMSALTRAMVGAGDRLRWRSACVVDKHCVGGLPGNRTTPIVVAIAAAAGLTIPKTSSRAITSPAGTADVMETMTRVDLSLEDMQRVVESEGGCLAWGGPARLSPMDDVLIRIERALDIDSEGQLVASVLSKKAAAGSTHVIIDIPVGATAKIRSVEAGRSLARDLEEVGSAIGLAVRTVFTDGSQPVGRGVGPALEAGDVLAVLRGNGNAPEELRQRSLVLAGHVLEIGRQAAEGDGLRVATALLADGRAWRKFRAICEAQGGFREPPVSKYAEPIVAPRSGHVAEIDNRRLARAAKLAGAPADPAAGLEIQVRLGAPVEKGQPLFTLRAESRGELDYALDYVRGEGGIVRIGEGPA